MSKRTPPRPNPILQGVLERRAAGLADLSINEMEKYLEPKLRKKLTPEAHHKIFNTPHPGHLLRGKTTPSSHTDDSESGDDPNR